ncbi:MAG: MFS transporter [Pseudomonadota bacterium]|nr:MFS transporter [Pseudomonadota bacterium]
MNQRNQSQRLLPFIIITLAATFYIYEFALRVMPSAMTNELMNHFAIEASGLGMMSALFFYGYAPMQIPAGLLIDRLGPRILLTGSVLICSLGAYIFGVTHHFTVAAIGRVMMGVGASFAYIGCLVLASRWFAAKYFALIAGLVQFLGCIGAIAGAAPIAVIVARFGWQQTQITSAYLGIFLSLLFWLVLRDSPKEKINCARSHHTLHSNSTEMQRLLEVLRNPQTWAIGLYGFCCWAPISILAELWGISFFSTAYPISRANAAFAIAFVWIGIAIFSPIIGWWSNRINSRRIPLISSGVVATLTSIAIIYVDTIGWPVMCILLILFGAAAGAMSVTFGMVQDNMPPAVAGTAVGFNNMAIIGGGVVFQPLVGLLLDVQWNGKLVDNLPLYTVQNYRYALIIIPILGVMSILTALFVLKETHCTTQYPLHDNNEH